MTTKKLNLDELDVYSSDAERVSNAIKRVIDFSDTEQKLFSCFDWYREKSISKDKALWDRCFVHFVNRELGRTNVSQDIVTKLKVNLDRQIQNFHSQHSVEAIMQDGSSEIDACGRLELFVKSIQEASKVDEYTKYADIVKAGHDEVVLLGHVLSSLWKHQEKYQEVLNDNTGNAQLNPEDIRDKALDFERYMNSRAKWFNNEEQQSVQKTQMQGKTGKEKRNAKKREKKKANNISIEGGSEAM